MRRDINTDTGIHNLVNSGREKYDRTFDPTAIVVYIIPLPQCICGKKKVKERIAVSGIPSHSYGTSLAIWDHTVLPATRHK